MNNIFALIISLSILFIGLGAVLSRMWLLWLGTVFAGVYVVWLILSMANMIH